MPKETNKKQNKEKQSKDKKHFWKDFRAELKRVIWPTPKQLLNNTVAVITIVLITAIIVFVLDFAFEKMNEYGIEKIKTIVETTNVVDNSGETSTEEDTTSENQTDTNTVDDNTQTNQTSENTEGE